MTLLDAIAAASGLAAFASYWRARRLHRRMRAITHGPIGADSERK